ncbi:hypothetical protein [Bordetella flabilis]|uniref:Uncharacterized protein n=1 Tax=Bordetella flabilis TaxID=463014 RepID=A0A193GMN8_9BORD|nr:hypothetical protein [Bordetella flabilis]ANN80873.1 hypothetical protein BAU07_26495 [Bordetella flabilis]
MANSPQELLAYASTIIARHFKGDTANAVRAHEAFTEIIAGVVMPKSEEYVVAKADLLHLMSGAIGAAYSSVEDGAQRLRLKSIRQLRPLVMEASDKRDVEVIGVDPMEGTGDGGPHEARLLQQRQIEPNPVAQDDKRPRVPEHIIACIQEYGDARADGAAKGAFAIGRTIDAIRDWGGTLSQVDKHGVLESAARQWEAKHGFDKCGVAAFLREDACSTR